MWQNKGHRSIAPRFYLRLRVKKVIFGGDHWIEAVENETMPKCHLQCSKKDCNFELETIEKNTIQLKITISFLTADDASFVFYLP